MLLQTQTDNSHVDGTIHAAETSINRRPRFGYGQRQRVPLTYDTWKVQPCVLNGHQLTTMKYLPFTKLPSNLQSELIKVFEAAHKFTEEQYPHSFPSDLRTKSYSNPLKAVLGFPCANFKFEYFGIVPSRNTVLPKHIDTKNDHREGYNICTVYSFYQFINDLEFKVSIIMTTRSAVGAAFVKATTNM